MTNFQILRSVQQYDWLAALEQSYLYDIYHLPAYQALAERAGEGLAHLFVFHEDNYWVMLPLLLRRIDLLPYHKHNNEGWWDATSVYGYAGPIASHPTIPRTVLNNYRRILRQTLLEHRVVSIFSRLHPLISQQPLLAGLGECLFLGNTVSINLTLSPILQKSKYRQNHKRDINRLRRQGIKCVHDQKYVYLNEFVDIYFENMRRVNADSSYFFEPSYFEQFTTTLGSAASLFVCLQGGEVISAGLFTSLNGIVQYHLGGTKDEYLRLAPMKLLLDTVRLWATEQDARVFHLGGGVGSQQDSLFNFKAGFSDQRENFAVWRWILLPDIYEQLVQEKKLWHDQSGLSHGHVEYFPAYRCPICLQG